MKFVEESAGSSASLQMLSNEIPGVLLTAQGTHEALAGQQSAMCVGLSRGLSSHIHDCRSGRVGREVPSLQWAKSMYKHQLMSCMMLEIGWGPVLTYVVLSLFAIILPRVQPPPLLDWFILHLVPPDLHHDKLWSPHAISFLRSGLS